MTVEEKLMDLTDKVLKEIETGCDHIPRDMARVLTAAVVTTSVCVGTKYHEEYGMTAEQYTDRLVEDIIENIRSKVKKIKAHGLISQGASLHKKKLEDADPTLQ